MIYAFNVFLHGDEINERGKVLESHLFCLEYFTPHYVFIDKQKRSHLDYILLKFTGVKLLNESLTILGAQFLSFFEDNKI